MNTDKATISGHPKSLYMLFFAEMWERFSFYGMKALLLLFMIKEFGFQDGQAYGIYTAYVSLVYATPFIGGILADKIIGYRKAVIFGAILMAIGHFVMAFPDYTESESLKHTFFYIALSFLIIGNGFFKPNMSNIVGTLYDANDPRKDAGFSIFYMGINLGAFLAPLVCGTVGEVYGWSYGFGLAGIGMLAGLVVFGLGQKSLGNRGLAPSNVALIQHVYVYVGGFIGVALVTLLIVYKNELIESGLFYFGAAAISYLLVKSFQYEKIEKERLWAILLLVILSIVFWTFFEQAGTSITLFTERNVDRLGIPSSLFLSLNPLFILLLAPFFSRLWTSLGAKGKDISTPMKFAIAILQVGLGFLAFVVGAAFVNDQGMVSIIWLVLGYLLHTTGELCLSPIGLSMVTKLAPVKIAGMVMGIWLLSSSLAQNLAGVVAKYTSTDGYMEKAVKYLPITNFVGTDVAVAKVYEEKIMVKGTTTIITDEKIIEAQLENLDTTKYALQKNYTTPITINIHVVENEEQCDGKNPRPAEYTIRKHVNYGEKLELNTRPIHLDPTGELKDIQALQQPYTTIADKTLDKALFQAPMQDTVVQATWQLADKGKESNKDILKYEITVDKELNHTPVALTDIIDYYMPKKTAFASTEGLVNILDYVKDADGDNLKVEVVDKGKIGLAKKGNTLNSFVDATKTIHIYTKVFWIIAICTVVVFLFALVITPLIKKWMNGVN